MKWLRIVIWCTALVSSLVLFAMRYPQLTAGVFLLVAILSLREILEVVFE